MNELKQRIIDDLTDLIGRYDTGGAGLCGQIDASDFDDDETEEILHECFRAWPEFSGEVYYPVWTDHNINPRFQFARDLCYVGEYGAARIRLAKFIVGRLTNEN
jgi:hypothetical protein